MMRALIILASAIAIVAIVGGGALLAAASRDDMTGIAIIALMLGFVIVALDWLARASRDEGVLAGRTEVEQLYDGIGRKKGEA